MCISCNNQRSDSGKSQRPRGAEKGVKDARLGILRNTYAGEHQKETGNPNKIRENTASKTASKNARRSDRFELQRGAAALTPNLRVAHCLWTPTGNQVDLLKRQNDARFNGVQTCGSVWSCPCCSARISEVRRQELRQLEEWAGSPRRNLRLVMMTLTARHRSRPLRDMVDRLSKAKRRMQNRKAWQRLRVNGQLFGTVSVREATHSAVNGWHPHYHVLCLVRADSDEAAQELLEPMRAAWLDCLRKEGLTGTARRAFDLQNGDAVSAYISKHGRDEEDRKKATKGRPAWGIAEEMTLGRTKRGGHKSERSLQDAMDDAAKKLSGKKVVESRSPWQILRDAVAGDEASEKLWQEYALVMHGRRQQVWSNGLKLACGVEEIDDDQAAEGEEFTEDQDETLLSWSKVQWRAVRHRRAEILDAAERGGSEEVERILGQTPDDDELIEEEDAAWRPRRGGLAEASLRSIRRTNDGLDASPGATELPNFISEIGNSKIGGGVAVGHEDFQSTALPPSSKHVEKPPPKIAM